MYKKCELCQKEFKVKKAEYDRRKTCSRKCFAELRSIKYETHCHVCGEKFFLVKSKIDRSKHHFCSNKCVGVFNSSKAVNKNCITCGKTFSVKTYRSNKINCSIECQHVWQANNLVGKKANNFRGGGRKFSCQECGKEFQSKRPSDKPKFCSTDCKHINWQKNVLHKTEKFITAQRNGNIKARLTKKETKPERLVREKLEELGYVKNKDFYQEQGMFRKYIVDFYFPKKKLIIEVYGDYWHVNPNIYDGIKKPIPPERKYQLLYDKEREAEFKKFNFKYFILWENDIYQNVENNLPNIITARND